MLLGQYLLRRFLKPVFLRFILKFRLPNCEISRRPLFQMSHSFKHSVLHSFILSTIWRHVHPTAHCQRQWLSYSPVTTELLLTSHPELLVIYSVLLTFGYASWKVVFKQSNLYYAAVVLHCRFFGPVVTYSVSVAHGTLVFETEADIASSSIFAINHTSFRKGHVLNFVGRT
jgi:hypothetical protein